MSFRKITKNIYERSWKRKDGTIAKTLYFWLMIDGKVVHQRAIDPDNPKKTARTKREAENFLAKWRVKLETDKQPEKSKPKEITWGKFVKDYYEPIAQAKLRHYGRSAGYQLRVLNAYFESKLIHTITHFDVERALLTERQKPGRDGERSNRTVNRIIERANVIFTLAVAEGFIEGHRNPMNKIAKLEEVPKVKRRLNQEDEEKILKACLVLKLDYVANATIILLETGMRPMELFEMKRDQVVLSEGYIKAISYKTGKRRTVTAQPKTRIIPLTGRARAEFEKLLALSKDDNVFPYKSIKKAWASICRTAGVQGLWFRWLRDEAENRWREAGMHPLDIAYLMGHASPRTTMIYNNPRREEIVRQMSAANPSKILAKTSGAAIADRS
jgi:integrase